MFLLFSQLVFGILVFLTIHVFILSTQFNNKAIRQLARSSIECVVSKWDKMNQKVSKRSVFQTSLHFHFHSAMITLGPQNNVVGKIVWGRKYSAGQRASSYSFIMVLIFFKQVHVIN